MFSISDTQDGVNFMPDKAAEILVELNSQHWSVFTRGLRRFTTERQEVQAMLELELSGQLNDERDQRRVDLALDRLVNRTRKRLQAL